MKKLIYIAAIACTGLFTPAQAQRVMRIHLADGSSETRNVADVVKITFEGEGEQPGPQPSGDKMVDLGLSVKWATYNIGATSPDEPGNFYAYGEIEPKEEYTLENYLWRYEDYAEFDCAPWEQYNRLGETITGSRYDVAHMKWGELWRMPTREEFNELINNCSWQQTGINGVTGMLGTSKINGNTIFFPCAGNMVDAEHTHDGLNAFLWTATEVEFQGNSDSQECRNYRACLDATYQMADGYDYPEVGFNVRAVYGEVPADELPDVAKPGADDMVDLGLSVKWSRFNLGASSPSGKGMFLCYGELVDKPYYHSYNYRYFNPWEKENSWDIGSYDELPENICGTEYDPCTAYWGDGWRLPTKDEIQELIDDCTWEYTSSGATVTGPNGNSIFLPAFGTVGYHGYTYRGNESIVLRSGEASSAKKAIGYALYVYRNGYGANFSAPEIKNWVSHCGGNQVRGVHE